MHPPAALDPAPSPARGAARARAAALATGLALAMTPWIGPTWALLGGLAFSLGTGQVLPRAWRALGRALLQVGVVGLGVTLSLGDLARVGATGLAMAAVTIALVFAVARWVGRWLGLEGAAVTLIAGGTAICGGSAIAAIGEAIEVEDQPMAVAMGTIFLLNAVALVAFPPLGHALGLAPVPFGTWAGIAIHDISSVVGAASAYHADQALITATTVKLSRTLWILPVTALAAIVHRQQVAGRAPVARPRRGAALPWFLVAFLVAALARSVVPGIAAAEHVAVPVSRALFAGSLFLVGAGVERAALGRAGLRPIALGVLLWAMVAAGSLLWVLA